MNSVEEVRHLVLSPTDIAFLPLSPDLPSRREGIHFYHTSLLTMQNAYSFAYSVGSSFGDAQYHSGGIYASAYHCWSQS